MSLKLHVFPLSPRAFKVMAAADYLGIDHDLCLCDLAKGDHKRPEFLALNPNGKMPVLEEDDFALWEANAILEYLASKKPQSGLMPEDARGRADVMRWLLWDMAHWDSTCAIFIFENLVKGLFGLGEPDPAEIAKGEQHFHQFAKVLDSHLKGRKYVCGDKLTIADFALGAPLNVAEAAQYPLAPYAEIKRWYANLAALPCWQKTLAKKAPAAA
jgi:glutathione S-transferase